MQKLSVGTKWQPPPIFHQLEPIENRDIGVDQVREVLATLQRFAQQEGNVVVYIRQAERLTEASCNALLKTLEEPHNGVYFLLETDLQAPMMATNPKPLPNLGAACSRNAHRLAMATNTVPAI